MNITILDEAASSLRSGTQPEPESLAVTSGQLALELDRIAALPHHYSRPVTVVAIGLAWSALRPGSKTL
jgi:hypothetical protein